MSQPPPPPPPHGENPRTTAGGSLPPGKYDVFIIPEHSAGAGFLYLPSLRPQWNSFIAGVVSTVAVAIMMNLSRPVLVPLLSSPDKNGLLLWVTLVACVGAAAFLLGRHQGAWEKAREEMRKREEERKAKEAEAKKKEDTARRLRELREREAKERERREREAREREVKEKLRQEQEARERERLEKEVREKVEKELREKAEKEAKERAARDREAREREARLKEEARKREEERARAERERQAAREREREAREAREARERKEREERIAARLRKEQEEREEKEREARKGTTYAYSSVGEKTSMWPNGRPPSVAPSHAASTPSNPKPASPAPPSPTRPTPTRATPSPTKPPPSATGTEDTYSYRPYDKPKKPTARKKSVSDMSESSWAPSASTARTTPPPSTRGPYSTNDPQKIVIRAVYGYLNQFSKTPASQLISGVAPVTDGLILRITSAGLFVDDDVRGVAQREWDIKAWTIKHVEVWCPVHAIKVAAASVPGSVPTNHPFFKTMPASARSKAERGATKTFLGEEAMAYIDEFGQTCNGHCRTAGRAAASSSSSSSSAADEWKGKGLHLLRATIRDQEGKRYLFVVGEDEAWKIAGGLAALRGSSQVRALGVAGFSGMESRSLLDTLGWG
ncbi:hypothetical protein BT67DRAFT_433590 [Trichocladium antarcticum]|uniref:Uncharacterized protein n=1 Tax=Trichocladium antarcticum TaxID=1450529 RepID=A0AAN6UMQ7_9PEZI|nr:hypothetical protein BT67DRAFT_433590 [Trichocladium antarcticum]